MLPLQRLQRQRRQQREVESARQAGGLLEVRDVLEALQESGGMFLGLPPQLRHARRSLIAARRYLGRLARWQQGRAETRHGLDGAAGAQSGETWKRYGLVSLLLETVASKEIAEIIQGVFYSRFQFI